MKSSVHLIEKYNEYITNREKDSNNKLESISNNMFDYESGEKLSVKDLIELEKTCKNDTFFKN